MIPRFPDLISRYCCAAYRDTQYPYIAVRVYHWCGTDRTTLIWGECRDINGGTMGRFSPICRLDLHYLDLYATFDELLADLPYLTKTMHDGGWKSDDIRGNNRRVFDADFW